VNMKIHRTMYIPTNVMLNYLKMKNINIVEMKKLSFHANLIVMS